MKYSRDSVTPAYPLSLIFDDDPKTAWVFSATSKEWNKSVWQTRFGLMLEPEHPVLVDGLRIMNGQNESLARFRRNNRVVKMRVVMNIGQKEVTRTFDLPDRMGWHKVSLPRHVVKNIKIEFTGTKKGDGPDNDLCISGLELLHHNRKVEMAMPFAVMFNDGLEGCNASFLISREGKRLDAVANAVGYEDKWSANGRYVCGFSGAGGENDEGHLWISDTWQGKIVRRVSRSHLEYSWLGNNRLHLKDSTKNDPFVTTIKLP